MSEASSQNSVANDVPKTTSGSLLSHRVRLFLTACILVGGIAPLLLYFQFIGRVPGRTVLEADETLRNEPEKTLMLDVRSPQAFNAGHFDGAENWPYEDIQAEAARTRRLADDTVSTIPARYKGRTLLVISEGGWKSARAVRRLRALAPLEVFNVGGGLQEWIATAGETESMARKTLVDRQGNTVEFPFRNLTRFEQWAAIGSGFVIKTIYMTLSLVLVAVLWRRRSPDLVALRWAFIFFYAGEAFCAGNYLFFNEQCYLFEYLHSYGMVVAFGFVAFALFDGIDRRLLFLSDPEGKCAALSLCGPCIKYADVPCGLRRVFQILIPSVLVLCFLPLCAVPVAESFTTTIFARAYVYSHHVYHQLYEIRFLPVVAVVFCAVAFAVLLFRKTDPVTPSKILFACALGALGFSLFRLFLLAPHRHNLVWFAFWEEITEFLFVVGVCYVLWVFRRPLFRTSKADAHLPRRRPKE